MFGLFGLLGVLVAGVVADTMMQMGSAADSDDDVLQDDAESADVTDIQNIFGMLANRAAGEVDPIGTARTPASDDSGQPISTDVVTAPDAWMDVTGTTLAENLNGLGGDDQIIGGGGADLLDGRAGADTLLGEADNDYLHGETGDDVLFGGHGEDVLHGENGDDLMLGGPGNDTVFGHPGDDTLQGGAGSDSLVAGDGADIVSGDNGDDEIAGGSGDDVLHGGGGADVLDGGDGADTIWGQMPDQADASADFLNGGLGDDTLMLGAGDYGNGGEGHDTYGLIDFGLGEHPIQITDFNPAEDALMVLYDPHLHPDPQLSVESNTDQGMSTLLLDGVPLANLTNGAHLDLAAITLRAA